MSQKRLEIARLFQRFGFGPKPGEFEKAMTAGVTATRQQLIAQMNQPSSLLPLPVITDLGARPAANSATNMDFSKALRSESLLLLQWWLDQMVSGTNQVEEKMVWFWHGHWATSIGKVNYPLPMLKQNQIFRKYALGNFTDFSKEMINDGALQIWLDGADNSVKAPNENLSREMMELFTLGVNRYTETDVRELARTFTGYQVKRSNGDLTLNPRRRDTNAVTILGKSGVLSAQEAVTHLVSQPNAAKFVAERIWYRFISSTSPLPDNHGSISAFANRDISSLVKNLIAGDDLTNSENSMVKSPVEWFIGVARALEITPSKLSTVNKLNGYLDKLAQIPFAPPNVGGWPVDEAWLSSASAQFRIAFATWLTSQSDLTTLNQVPFENRVTYIADLLGVVQWSARTNFALREARENPQQLLTLAICSPEYVVSV